MIAFPPFLAPPAPFPLVLSQSVSVAFVAPGIRRADYRLVTNLGPLAVHVVAIDPAEPTVRIGAVVARDRLVSAGETVSAMAARTGAVAGVNADYFDIGQTNQPLNVVVRDGVLARSPSKRAAMLVGPHNAVTFGGFGFSGTASWPGASVPLTTFNEYPPQGGAGFVTPAFGALSAANASVTAATLEPQPSTSPGRPGTYRVTAVGPTQRGPVTTPFLALGPAALKIASAPNVGDDVTIAYATVPPTTQLQAAVGGGPLLLVDGAAYDDPNAPAPEERNVRFPVSGCGTAADGTVFFAAVDGRRTAQSIGVTRPEFGALFAGLGATNALAFDSGGSATLVGRVLGDARASVLNVPSDGTERPVADGVFAYSTAPVGPPATLTARPATFAALPGAAVAIAVGAVDAAGHPVAGTRTQTIAAPTSLGAHAERLAADGLTLVYPYRVVARAAHLRIDPVVPNPEPGGAVTLTLAATASDGTDVALPPAVWHADRGTVRGAGDEATYTAAARDALVTASVPGGAAAQVVVRVGRRPVPIALAPANAPAWTFASAPAALGGNVAVSAGPGPTLALAYDFSGSERAAYARTAAVLPGTPLGFGIAVDDGGRTLLIRGLFMNTLGEKRAFTLTAGARAARLAGTATVDGPARVLGVDFPSDLYPPVTLLSLYALPQPTTPRAPGSVTFRAPFVVAPGTP